MDNCQIVLRLNIQLARAENHVARAHLEAGLPMLAVCVLTLELQLLYGVEGHYVRGVLRKHALQITRIHCFHPTIHRLPYLCLCRIGSCISLALSPLLDWE